MASLRLFPARAVAAAAGILLLAATALLLSFPGSSGLSGPLADDEPIACVIDPINGGYFCVYRDF